MLGSTFINTKKLIHLTMNTWQACKRYFLKVIRYRFSFFFKKCNYYNYILAEVISLQFQLHFRYFCK